MKKLKTIYSILFALLLLIAACKQNVAQWRGTNRDGIYHEKNLLNEWPEKGPELLWTSKEIGNGYASPSVSDNKLFINGEIDGKSYLFAFSLSGKLLWKSPNGQEFMGNGYSATFPGARSAPTIIDDLVYCSSGKGRIACYETNSGIEKWAVDMVTDLDGYENEFGYSESLAVDDTKVYCFPGGTDTNMAALDRYTGKTIWTSKALGDTTSFCSPILVNLEERKILVTVSRHNLFTIDCENGGLLSSYTLDGFKYDGEHCNTPIYADGHIYYVSEEEDGKGAIKLKLSSDGKKMTEIWFNKKIRNGFGGFIKTDNNLFTTIKGNWLKSIELNSGTVSDSIKVATGSLIYADKKFICYSTNGDVSLINYDQQKLEVTSEFKIKEGTNHHFAHPVLADGIMYIRHGNALMAYKIK